jgi:hypothetical protein
VSAWLAPILLLVVVIATDLWVYLDARRCARAGSPVYFRIGSLGVDTPVAWLVACIIVWIFFFPAYLASRSPS